MLTVTRVIVKQGKAAKLLGLLHLGLCSATKMVDAYASGLKYAKKNLQSNKLPHGPPSPDPKES